MREYVNVRPTKAQITRLSIEVDVTTARAIAELIDEHEVIVLEPVADAIHTQLKSLDVERFE